MKSKSKSNFKSNSKSKKYLKIKRRNSSRNSRTKIKINTKTKRKQIGGYCPILMTDKIIHKTPIKDLNDIYNRCCPKQKGDYFGTTKNKAPFCQKINNRLEQQTKKQILDINNTFDPNYNERPTSTIRRSSIDSLERPTNLSQRSTIDLNNKL